MREENRAWRVGLLVVSAVTVLAVGILLIGEQSNLFSRKNGYTIAFANVGGLNSGNPVQLEGVEVGTVQRIVLPTDAESTELEVTIEVDRRYAERIREDSMARIKTLGLLGDKFVDLTAGSAAAPVIPPGGQIPAAPPTNVDKLVASGEDVMDNVVQISADLRNVLRRMERGEGLLGELTTDSEAGKRVTDSIVETMATVERVANEIETGDGTLPRLINDAELAGRISGSVERLEIVLTRLDEGEGLLPTLLRDPATTEEFTGTLAKLREVATNLEEVSRSVSEGEGLLPRLIGDEEYGREVTREIDEILERINGLTRKLDEGEGAAAKFINDPAIYDAVNDVIIGVNESRILRWLVRNRQKKGIETRYEEATGGQEPPAESEPPEAAGDGHPPG